MRNLIYQYYRQPESKTKNATHTVKTGFDYHELSKQSISKYAEKCGAEYKFLDEPLRNDISPFFGIFLPFFNEWCYEYDNVCFVDSDMFATIHSENIFDHASKDFISACLVNTVHRWGAHNPAFKWFTELGGNFNSGIVVFPRPVYSELIKYLSDLDDRMDRLVSENNFEWLIGSLDQSQVNLFIRDQSIANDEKQYKILSDNFNFHMNVRKHSERFDADKSWLIHYHRDKKRMMKEDFENDAILK